MKFLINTGASLLRPCVPRIHVAAKWTHVLNQDRCLVQSSLQKLSGQGPSSPCGRLSEILGGDLPPTLSFRSTGGGYPDRGARHVSLFWGVRAELLRIAICVMCPTLESPNGVAPDSEARHVSSGGGKKKANAGVLTNFEVLDFLRYRGAAKDPTWVIAPIAASEFKAYDYLVESAACNKTTEILNITNMKPTSPAEIDLGTFLGMLLLVVVILVPLMLNIKIIEECEKQMGEEIEDLVEIVMTVLPPPQTQMNLEEEVGVDQKKLLKGIK
ncbi:hypothetical protein CK203_068872 [Vitis vinifera]|uniref:RNA polymerase Rpb4/RPC9 core domain-containing protein n=1 Tax=Vitis vinifera TaxID=29760 RepID=A0A438EY20_VITVI|nr:hypothetical protein CK203_068872 [Vitis vinifera]